MFEAREFETEFGVVRTVDVPIEELPVGAVIAVPDVVVDGELVVLLEQVTVDCLSDQRGWLRVYDMGFDTRGPRGRGDDGSGFFDFAHGTAMYQVVEAENPDVALMLDEADAAA